MIPEFLTSMLTHARGTVVAAWDLAVPAGDRFTMGDLRKQLTSFQEAFPWARLRSLEGMAMGPDGQVVTYAEGTIDGAQSEWMCRGMEGWFDLFLFWQDHDGKVASDWIGPAAGLMITREPDDAPTVQSTLSLGVNVFTDDIYRAAGQVIHLPAAAKRNRQALRESLARWQDLTGGRIVSCTEEVLTPESVDLSGIRENAEQA